MQNLISFLNYTFTGNLAWLEEVYKTLPPILYSILALVGGAGTVYAIILGVNLAKSESDDKRKSASTRLKNTLIGVGVLLVLVLFINLLLPMILHAVFPNEVLQSSTGSSNSSGGGGGDVNQTIKSIVTILKRT